MCGIEEGIFWLYLKTVCDQYFENSAVTKTYKNGNDIFSNDRNFKVFEQGFREGINETIEFLEKAKKTITIYDKNKKKSFLI